MDKISSKDRSNLIRLASSLPAGDPNRKAILSSLTKKKASQNKLIYSGKPHLFTRNDWNAYAGAEAWLDAQGNILHQPWILEAEIFGSFEDIRGFENPGEIKVLLIADSQGLVLELSNEEGWIESLTDSEELEPSEGPGMLKMLLRSLLSGRVPAGFSN